MPYLKSVETHGTIGQPEKPHDVCAILREGSPDLDGEPLQGHDGPPPPGEAPGCDHPAIDECDWPENTVGSDDTNMATDKWLARDPAVQHRVEGAEQAWCRHVRVAERSRGEEPLVHRHVLVVDRREHIAGITQSDPGPLG